MTSLPDALVVGGGIVGAAVAEALVSDGARVTLVEARFPGCGATAAGMGHLVTLDGSEAELELTRYSRRLWIERDWEDAVEFERCGTIWVAADDEEMAHARRKAEGLETAGVSSRLLDDQALREAEPELRRDLPGGLLVPDDGVVYQPAALAAILRAAGDRGLKVLRDCPVRRCDEGFVLLEDGRRLDAGLVVDAAGLAALDLLEEPPAGAAIRPKKGHLVVTERAPGFLRHQLVELGYVKRAHENRARSVAFNVQPRRNGQILIGSSRQVDVGDREVDGALVATMLRRAFEYLPRLGSLRAIRTWTGLRPTCPDNLPLIGPLPGRTRLWIAAGHEGLGITTALATGRLLADLAAGRSTAIDARPYRPDRFAGASAHG